MSSFNLSPSIGIGIILIAFGGKLISIVDKFTEKPVEEFDQQNIYKCSVQTPQEVSLVSFIHRTWKDEHLCTKHDCWTLLFWRFDNQNLMQPDYRQAIHDIHSIF